MLLLILVHPFIRDDNFSPESSLFWRGDASAPLDVYCHGMNTGSPQEYITVTSADNYARYGGSTAHNDCRT